LEFSCSFSRVMTQNLASISSVSGAQGVPFNSLALSSFLVNLGFFRHAQAIGHGDDADAVEERLVVLVGLEDRPLRLVEWARMMPANGMGPASPCRCNCLPAWPSAGDANTLIGRLEHLDEFEQSLIGAAQSAREGIGVGIVLAEMFELADIDLARGARKYPWLFSSPGSVLAMAI